MIGEVCELDLDAVGTLPKKKATSETAHLKIFSMCAIEFVEDTSSPPRQPWSPRARPNRLDVGSGREESSRRCRPPYLSSHPRPPMLCRSGVSHERRRQPYFVTSNNRIFPWGVKSAGRSWGKGGGGGGGGHQRRPLFCEYVFSRVSEQNSSQKGVFPSSLFHRPVASY